MYIDLDIAYRISDVVLMVSQLSLDWRKILEVLILGQFVVDKVLVFLSFDTILFLDHGPHKAELSRPAAYQSLDIDHDTAFNDEGITSFFFSSLCKWLLGLDQASMEIISVSGPKVFVCECVEVNSSSTDV